MSHSVPTPSLFPWSFQMVYSKTKSKNNDSKASAFFSDHSAKEMCHTNYCLFAHHYRFHLNTFLLTKLVSWWYQTIADIGPGNSVSVYGSSVSGICRNWGLWKPYFWLQHSQGYFCMSSGKLDPKVVMNTHAKSILALIRAVGLEWFTPPHPHLCPHPQRENFRNKGAQWDCL